MSFQRQPWLKRDKPTESISKPVAPYADSVNIPVDEDEQFDIDLQQYVREGPVNVIGKPYFVQIVGTHAIGRVPRGQDKSYPIVIQDDGGEY